MKSFYKYRPTLLCLMILIALAAIFINFLVMPGININERHNSYWVKGIGIVEKPFWPQYWRKLRHIPEPQLAIDIETSKDGGLIIMTAISGIAGLLIAYKFKKSLFIRTRSYAVMKERTAD